MARLDPRFRGDATQPPRVGMLIECFIAWMARCCGP